MFKQHSWKWLLDHSASKDVEALRIQGFGAVAVLPYFFLSTVHKDAEDRTVTLSVAAKKEGKLIVFHRGVTVRIAPYTKQMVKELAIHE